MIELRKEFDMPKIDKLIKSKLPKDEFDSQIQNTNYQLDVLQMRHGNLHTECTNLSRNLIDIHKRINILEDSNRDVLLGRRNGNCISCSKMKDGYEALKFKDGTDGKLYMTSGKAQIGKGMSNLDTAL